MSNVSMSKEMPEAKMPSDNSDWSEKAGLGHLCPSGGQELISYDR